MGGYLDASFDVPAATRHTAALGDDHASATTEVLNSSARVRNEMKAQRFNYRRLKVKSSSGI
jgi:hypothetical protein